jgi:hypothetical protein
MFKITITEIKPVERVTTEYQKVAETGNPRDNGPAFDYVPVTRVQDAATEVYSQTVAELDIVAVIAAVNEPAK